MRHTYAAPNCWVPSVVNPVSWRAERPLPGSPGAQATTTPPPSEAKSTTTVTPDVDVWHCAADAAPGAIATVAASESRTAARPATVRGREPHLRLTPSTSGPNPA